MNFEVLLIIVGSFLTLMLGINAYFLKGIFSDLNNVKVNIARIFERSTTRDATEKELKEKVAKLEDLVDDIKFRLHTLEGTNNNVMQFIKDYEFKE